MTKIRAGILGAVIAASCVTPLVVQHRALADLRDQNAFLRQQVAKMAPLSTENQRLSNLLAATPSQPLPSGQLSKLMRLRGIAGVQKGELGKLRAELAARNNSATSQALKAPASTNYFPKESWGAAGYATPEAAVQSLTWAANQAAGQAMAYKDIKRLLALIPPDKQAAASKHFADKSDSDIFTELARDSEQVGKTEGIRIVNKQAISDDVVVLTYYMDGPDGFGSMRLKRYGNDWKPETATPQNNE